MTMRQLQNCRHHSRFLGKLQYRHVIYNIFCHAIAYRKLFSLFSGQPAVAYSSTQLSILLSQSTMWFAVVCLPENCQRISYTALRWTSELCFVASSQLHIDCSFRRNWWRERMTVETKSKLIFVGIYPNPILRITKNEFILEFYTQMMMRRTTSSLLSSTKIKYKRFKDRRRRKIGMEICNNIQ